MVAHVTFGSHSICINSKYKWAAPSYSLHGRNLQACICAIPPPCATRLKDQVANTKEKEGVPYVKPFTRSHFYIAENSKWIAPACSLHFFYPSFMYNMLDKSAKFKQI